MTVIVSPGRLSWKVTIPISISLLAIGIGVWFLPVYGYYFEQRLWKYFLNTVVSLSSLTLIGMTVAWTIGNNKKGV